MGCGGSTAKSTTESAAATPAAAPPAEAPAKAPATDAAAAPATEPVASASKELVILHFNDVYNIEEGSKDPVGGASRFTAAVNSYRKGGSNFDGSEPLVLFSGDAFNPSLTSTIYKGKQMVPCLNAIKPAISVYGNHDFDFGLDNLHKLAEECNFPWLMSNVKYKPTGKQLADGIVYKMIDWEGHKVGVFGLVEWEWMATLATIEESEVEYEDFVTCADRLAKELRGQGATFIVALTHMRVPNDERLAHECAGVDLICGGHDHHYDCKAVGAHGTWVLKSGTDFRDLTVCRVKFGEGDRGFNISTEHIEITAEMPKDEEVEKVVQHYSDLMGQKMEQVLGQSAVDLDARFKTIRTSESNIGNLVCDIMRDGCNADVALLNSGTLRADTIIPAGPLRLKEFVSLLPMVDELCVLGMDGNQIMSALENGVCQYPRLEGRFPQVSGISFKFDATQEPGSRIVSGSVTIGGEPLQMEGREYKVCVKAYLALGKDGYDVFKECKMLVDSEAAPVLPSLVRNYFTHFGVLNGFRCAEGPAKSTVERKAQEIAERPSTAKAPRVDTAQRKDEESESRDYDYMVCPTNEDRILCVAGAIQEEA